MQYLQRLRESSRFYEFEKLGTQNLSIEDELIQLHQTEGMADIFHKCKRREQLQINNLSLSGCPKVIQQLELIKKNKILLR